MLKRESCLPQGLIDASGGKTLHAKSFSSWGDVELIFEFWVDRLTYRMCKAREDTGCIPPQ
jgi:hypothetical protein